MNEKPEAPNRLSTFHTIRAIGKDASRLLGESSKISIIGVIRHGVFLLVDDRHVVFTSPSPYRSPITVNFAKPLEIIHELRVGEFAFSKPGELVFPSIGLMVSWNDSHIWHTPPKPQGNLNAEDQQPFIRFVCSEVIKAKTGETGLTPILARFLAIDNPGTLEREMEPFWNASKTILASFDNGLVDPFSEAASRIIGLGRGLTPSGDDLLAGALLILNRWPEIGSISLPRKELNETLIEMARRKTTKLSASIIEQATRGEGDERVIKIADLLTTGVGDKERIIQEIAQMGHSSGVDTLTGMALVLDKFLHSNAICNPGGIT